MFSTRFIALVVALVVPSVARAACNLIPSASRTFRGTLGDVNRPFAAPGDFVEVGVSAARCGGTSPGFSAVADDQIVTVVFEPPNDGVRHVAFVTTLDCNGGEAAGKLAACEATVGAGRVSCVQAGDLGASVNLAIVDRNGERRLAFRFPDTDALFAPDADQRAATGPATIAVSPVDSPLPCGLATTTCAAQTGLLACVDTLFAADGSCQAVPAEVFSSFTALPQPNDFQSDCFADDPPCTGLASETRLAVDAGGNLFLPVHWSGVLIRQNDLPVPRLIRATIKSPLPFPIPDAAFLASYTPEGAKLPPIFEPQSDPSIADPDVITLFGSADASYTILRFARRAGRCVGGAAAGNACNVSTDCRGGTCPTTCVGGATPDAVCASDAECGGGRCGALFDDFRPIAAWGGPLPIRRQAAGTCLLPPHVACAGPGDCPAAGDLCVGAGICQLAPHGGCANDGDCPASGDACVSYALEANTAIPLESLTAGTTDVFAFTVNESTRLSDESGDGDDRDSVVTLRNRETGVAQAMGAPAACNGVAADAQGRAVVRISDPPFAYPAVETEGNLVAFLESESAEGYCDQSGDDDRSDPILRVFALGGGERTATLDPEHVADAALLVNDKALAISNGLVFYRRPERGAAPTATSRVNLGPAGIEADADIEQAEVGAYFNISDDGRFVLFESAASNLVADDTNGFTDAFVHDRQTGVTERVSLKANGTELTQSVSLAAAISGDGRYVAFGSLDPTVVAGDTNDNADVFVRDRLLGTTERVSVATGGGEGTGGPAFLVASDAVDISADGRFVLFYSQYTNLVPNDTNDDYDLFVRDRLAGTTERVNVRSGGGQVPTNQGSFYGALSANGRFVVFDSNDSGIVPGDTGSWRDVFVHDRLTQQTERVSVTSDGNEAGGTSGNYGSMDISADGRIVVFGSRASFVPSDVDPSVDVYAHDRLTGITELVSVATGGVPLPGGANAPSGSAHAAISGDGRFVGWHTSDSANAVPGDDNGVHDAFVYDRLTATTERVSVGAGGAQAAGGDSFQPVLSFDGSIVAFTSAATNLVAGDTLGHIDAFVRAPNLAAPGLDLFADGAIDDTLLEVFDADAQTATTLCPAGEVAVAAGRAVFLRPESAVGTGACPGGSLNSTVDADTDDQVVQLWQGGGAVVNLGLAATRVALSASHMAALADEAGQAGAVLNGDGDAVDQVVHVRAIGAGAWTNVAEAADTLAVCGTLVPFITPEAAQGADRNGDTVLDDRILQIWDTAGPGALFDTQRGAEEFVCGDSLIAFRSPESTTGTDRNGDGDATDDVLTVYDMTTGLLHESGQAVVPCGLAECDPREPYRVLSRSVKFLTLEAEQGPTDLNGDGDMVDLVIQTFDVDTGLTTVIGTVREGANPFGGGEIGDTGSATVYVSSGRCLELLGGFCTGDAQCPATTTCWNFGCARETGVCAVAEECSPGSTCVASGIVPASPDSDADGVPDHLDNCPDTAPADQTDTDGDGVGDVCDVLTCGNGAIEGAETCDGTSDAACPGTCGSDCQCCQPVADPKAVVKVTTAKEAGMLLLKMSIPLTDYDDQPVSVRLLDDDGGAIATTDVGSLPAKGNKGVQWLFKVKTLGLQEVNLKDDARKHPGMFKVVAKAKRWFTAAQANQPAADSSVQLRIGNQCFSHVVTKKQE
ncbi:MAG TPA: hypothetical protein VGR62_00900 [Candidatus Binatia bacterium]|jgi:hypothetical protein|nr:hypothetical protein [Candidatus Binatia bacterium]